MKRRIGIQHPNFGKRWTHSVETRRHYAAAKWNEQNPQWKGNTVDIPALHRWVFRHKPKPRLCEACKTRTPYDLANISQKYKRDVVDYEWLCRKCHMTKDGRMNNLKQYQNRDEEARKRGYP